MTRERRSKALQSFFESNPSSGELKFLTESHEKRSRPITRAQREHATNRWWEGEGLEIFSQAAESWKQKSGSETLYVSDINLNLVSSEMSLDAAEEELRESFRKAKGLHVTSFDIAVKIKNQAILIRSVLQAYSRWIGGYLDWVGNILADEYKVNQKNRENLVKYLGFYVNR